MSTPPSAYVFVKEFDPEERKLLTMDHHYLLYASKGAMRLEAGGTSWTLPPARAALIHAGREIAVTMPQRLFACSALFDPSVFNAPKNTLSVFEMSPLARELILACQSYGPSHTPDAMSDQLFRTLATVTWQLAENPASSGMPMGRTAQVKKALELTETQLAEEPVFDDIAKEVGASPRSLARKFSDELGMTWRQALRRMRMIKAIELLAMEPLSITEIAIDTGYKSVSAFNAAFRDFTGETPTEYRGSFGGCEI